MIESRAVRSFIDVGHRNGDFAEVLGGLSTGDVVVLHPSDRVTSGTRLAERGK